MYEYYMLMAFTKINKEEEKIAARIHAAPTIAWKCINIFQLVLINAVTANSCLSVWCDSDTPCAFTPHSNG